jgi:hypothetical protein
MFHHKKTNTHMLLLLLTTSRSCSFSVGRVYDGRILILHDGHVGQILRVAGGQMGRDGRGHKVHGPRDEI